eukprot:226364_1
MCNVCYPLFLVLVSLNINLVNSFNTTNAITTTTILTTTFIYTTSHQCTGDTSPDAQYTCLDYYRWGQCDAEWVKGFCCGTCGYQSCLNICYNGDINNIPSKYYPNPFDCTSDIHPGTDATCQQRKEWGNCNEGWLYGFCCSSCPNQCNCDTNNHISSIITTTTTGTAVVTLENTANDTNICTDNIPPPPGEYTCNQQYTWGKCEEDWMSGYCCMSCPHACECHNDSTLTYHPYDCTENISPSDEHSCIQQASWSKCGEDWMKGHCCISCPEACGCESYEWGNNTEYIKHIATKIIQLNLTTEEIDMYQKLFLWLHFVAAFFIALIPIIIVVKYGKEYCLFKLYEKKVLPAMVGHISDGSSSDSSDPTGKNNGSDLTVTETKSRSGRGRASTTSERPRIYRVYQLFAFISILFWLVRTILEVVNLHLWINYGEYAEHTAVTRNIVNLIFFVFGKMFMYISFILRIQHTFEGSAYNYSKNFIMVLITVLMIDTLMKIVCFWMVYDSVSGNIVDKSYTAQNTFEYVGLIFLVIEEILFSLALIIAFVIPLFKLSKETMGGGITDITTKYGILGILATLSTAVISSLMVLFVNTSDQMLVWVIVLISSIDCVVNSWCTILFFSFTDSWYMIMCGMCHNCIKNSWTKKLESDIIEMNKATIVS